MKNFLGIPKQKDVLCVKLVRYEELQLRIEEYIEWYNNVQSKVKMASLSSVEYRT